MVEYYYFPNNSSFSAQHTLEHFHFAKSHFNLVDFLTNARTEEEGRNRPPDHDSPLKENLPFLSMNKR